MSDKKPKYGDQSSLADEIPDSVVDRSVVRTPLQSVEEGDAKGETARPLLGPDGKPVGVPTRVTTSRTGEEQLRELQCKQKPCANCKHGFFPAPGSREYRVIEKILADAHGKLGIWPELGPKAFKWCEEDPVEGAGGKYLGYNCPAFAPGGPDLLPDYVPEQVKKAVLAMKALSMKLLTSRTSMRKMLALIQGRRPE